MKLAAFAFHKATTPLVGINSRSHMDIPGICSSRPVDAHRILQILLPYLTSDKWIIDKRKPAAAGLFLRRK
ncbi:hypothetical protein CC684_07460 [Salmonella enterica subsp. enterica serovar Bareilly]|uniref:Uncharacterized protein n=5 Tax=Salmonella enterica I TaxID=59201 RepID=A0A3U4AK82_SALET|nr:hypothetical protein CHD70_09685 [Salmonella enterica]EAA1656123.1 hypothetical protein [Salmonella enterica subsp. enterica serovar Newport]EAA3739688.1 hypothetical protein [Salmonella enterica subsp. enterica serovar Virchow]EAA6604611.1 hypothetical protein [Salmonella enterica subsp. enterica]EAB7031775.1 hypothetical protein [Salmonella enterica subsp. enterica serovar Weltevreden]EBF8086328.1 hypothetical protein [Salmonella enterica subsp. enterica serovar Gaminara]EBG0180049.1 hyp